MKLIRVIKNDKTKYILIGLVLFLAVGAIFFNVKPIEWFENKLTYKTEIDCQTEEYMYTRVCVYRVTDAMAEALIKYKASEKVKLETDKIYLADLIEHTEKFSYWNILNGAIEE